MCPAAALPQPAPWLKERRKRPKYCFTAAVDEEIPHAYHLYVDHNNRKAIGSCARKLGLPKWLVSRRGGALGLARVKEPAWSAEEVALLKRWGHLTDAVIQGKLKAAGFHAVHQRDPSEA